VSRLDAGRLQLEREDVDLAELVRDVVARLEPDLTRAGCHVSLHIASEVVGKWDRSRIDRGVTNLLTNALKFGAGRPIEIEVAAEQGSARLSVRDHGIGIEAPQTARIFERFERGV